MENLLGVVLCGGESKRMGTDKGLIKFDITTWAAVVASIIEKTGLQLVVSVNNSQLENYTAALPGKNLVIDSVEVNGPLKGILSVHRKYPELNLLVLACDMIEMKSYTLHSLIIAFKNHLGHDFYVYHNGEYFEPLCGIYTSVGLKRIDQKLRSGVAINESLQQVLKSSDTQSIRVTDSESFKNFNSK